MRIDKYLHDQQLGTRSQIHELIKQRRVTLNEQPVKSFKQGVDPLQDRVIVDGQVLGHQTEFYYLMNKPMGVITATTDLSQTTVMDLLSKDDFRSDLFPVGRLDKDTTGALLITNDGQLAHQLVSPKTHVAKTYEAHVTGTLSNDQIQVLQDGIELKNGDHVKADSASIVGQSGHETNVKLQLHQGKYHQIKRMFGALGQRVVQLHRAEFAGLGVTDLSDGNYRALTDKEIELLKNKTSAD
ncbi:pseudouridine synthase [Paucilactobacillus kaifaensis]|uniref:pseudouridine synthase n=1 Tax=Paucilactobacillus kaifaensis TaxID=2559921 RepID=UPI0010F46C64|nr:pseudouridine synthase [Paucilactobacillus kaifaensis]